MKRRERRRRSTNCCGIEPTAAPSHNLNRSLPGEDHAGRTSPRNQADNSAAGRLVERHTRDDAVRSQQEDRAGRRHTLVFLRAVRGPQFLSKTHRRRGGSARHDGHHNRDGDHSRLGSGRCIPDSRLGEKPKQPPRRAAWRVAATMSPPTADPTALARDLVRCPSVTPAEGGALGLIEGVLKAAGFEVHRVTFAEPGSAPVENLYARIGKASPHLAFAGHTDVVPPGEQAKWTHPPFAGEIADGTLYGRGAVDMK